jgi:hypothetical protein
VVARLTKCDALRSRLIASVRHTWRAFLASLKRPLTATERKSLSSGLRSDTFGWKSWATASLAAFIAASFVASMLARQFNLQVKEQWLVVSVLLALWLVVSVPLFRVARKRFGAGSLHQDIVNGVADVDHFEITESIELEEYEDLGPAYFVRTKEGAVYFFMGQYLYDLVDDRQFPCTEFETVRAPLSGVLLDFVCSGKSIVPTKRLGPFKRENLRRGEVPADGTAVSIAWERIEATYA